MAWNFPGRSWSTFLMFLSSKSLLFWTMDQDPSNVIKYGCVLKIVPSTKTWISGASPTGLGVVGLSTSLPGDSLPKKRSNICSKYLTNNNYVKLNMYKWIYTEYKWCFVQLFQHLLVGTQHPKNWGGDVSSACHNGPVLDLDVWVHSKAAPGARRCRLQGPVSWRFWCVDSAMFNIRMTHSKSKMVG